MSYQHIGEAAVSVSPFVDLAQTQPLTWNSPGWGSVTSPSLISTFKPLLPNLGWKVVMLCGIKPGGYIPFHIDADPESEDGQRSPLLRSHIVLATNPRCWSFHDGSWAQLQAGSVYRMDPTLEHASINLGPSTRYHLIVDHLQGNG